MYVDEGREVVKVASREGEEGGVAVGRKRRAGR